MLSVTPIKAFQDNYIWCIEHEESKTCVVIDPGDARPVKEHLLAKQLSLTAILVTHHHFDHVGGINDLKAHFDTDVIGPNNPAIKQITKHVKSGDQVQLLGTTFHVTEVPGHTLDHLAFFSDQDATHMTPWLFCGDTLFSAGCGRLFEGTPKQMLDSLNQLSSLPQSTEVFCAHEYTLANLKFAQAVLPGSAAIERYRSACEARLAAGKTTIPTTIKVEREINPFLNSNNPDVIASVASHTTPIDQTPLSTFTALRAWKDTF